MEQIEIGILDERGMKTGILILPKVPSTGDYVVLDGIEYIVRFAIFRSQESIDIACKRVPY